MNFYEYYLYSYELTTASSPRHQSATCVLHIALDHYMDVLEGVGPATGLSSNMAVMNKTKSLTNANTTKHLKTSHTVVNTSTIPHKSREVAIKLMFDRLQFLREIESRQNARFNGNFVLGQ